MKTLFYSSLVLLVSLAGLLHAQQNDGPNVISYYAVGNSMDGQPVIGVENVIRFYPVFALRQYVDTVRVTVYIGPHVYTRTADRFDNGRYWQALLPTFDLGESIQRIEVETSLDLGTHPLLEKYAEIEKELQNILTAYKDSLQKVDTVFKNTVASLLQQSLVDLGNSIRGDFTTYIGSEELSHFNKLKITEPSRDILTLLCRIDSLDVLLRKNCHCLHAETRNKLEDVYQHLNAYIKQQGPCDPPDADAVYKARDEIDRHLASITPQYVNQVTASTNTAINNLKSTIPPLVYQAATKAIDSVTRNLGEVLLRVLHVRDSLRALIVRENLEQLHDTMFAGPGVRRADVIFDQKSLRRARILYRNYKTALRNLMALDPAERIGIFRARYVPLLVHGKELVTAFSDTSQAVFEIGLGFSYVAVSGDDFVMPELSIRRLGIAFAVTSKLFGNDARIRALAVTYDFNAYGSIAIGANFPGKDTSIGYGMQSYVSFGINRIAFQRLVAGLAGLFNR